MKDFLLLPLLIFAAVLQKFSFSSSFHPSKIFFFLDNGKKPSSDFSFRRPTTDVQRTTTQRNEDRKKERKLSGHGTNFFSDRVNFVHSRIDLLRRFPLPRNIYYYYIFFGQTCTFQRKKIFAPNELNLNCTTFNFDTFYGYSTPDKNRNISMHFTPRYHI